VLNSRPKQEEEPKLDNFKFIEEDLSPLPDNGILVKTIFLSVDPYMRGRMNDEKSYVSPFQLNEVIVGGGVGQIMESNNSEYPVGNLVYSFEYPWKTLVQFEGENLKKLEKLDIEIDHPSYALSILGMPGMTAYFGLTEICQPKKGEVVLVTGAAGAVGSLVGQIAKIIGCKVIGIAGSDEKIKKLKELGFDEAINYKDCDNLSEAIKKACPDGIDCFYDNVGGPTMDIVIDNLNIGARITLCGAISQYNGKNMTGPRKNWTMITKGIKAQGFIVFREFQNRYHEGFKQMGQWLKEGKLKMEETSVDGFENAPQGFVDLFSGKNIGKMIITVMKPEISH